MKILNKVVVSHYENFFEDELNKLYNEYSNCNINVQFSPVSHQNTLYYTALVEIRGEIDGKE